METSKFDDLIRQKTDAIKVSYQPGHWERLARSLDTPVEQSGAVPSPHDALLDKQVAQRLNQLRAPGSAADSWPLLESRVRENTRLRQRLYVYKGIEVSLLVLLLLSIIHGYPYLKPALPVGLLHRHHPSVSVVSTPPAASALEHVERVQPAKLAASVDTERTESRVSGGGSLGNRVVSESGVAVRSKGLTGFSTLRARQSVNPLKSAELPRSGGGSPEISEVPAQGVLSLPAIASPQFLPEMPMDSDRDARIEYQRAPRKAMLNIAMLGGADYNRVMTPPNYEFRLEGFNRYTSGYGGGVLLGMEYGRIEVGSGLIYAAKAYQPLPVIFVKGSTQKGFIAESLDGIQLNLVNLPVYLRYDAIKKDKWRAYVVGGASLQIALQANYFISPPITLPAASQTPVIESEIQNRTVGWLQGGSFKENSYVTANLGIGLERFVSERWSVFAQPTYHQSIGYFANGLGPNLDRIHTLSLWTGIRVRVID